MSLNELEIRADEYWHSKEHKDFLKQYNAELIIRNDFVNSKFTIDKLRLIGIDDYVEGKGNKESFCYLIEFGMQAFGQIRGSWANSKFVLHYSKKASEYSFRKGKFGKYLNEVFNNVRNEIIQLVIDGANDNFEGLESNKLSEMFRGKIYFVYYPDKSLPIYNIEHINYFITQMGLEECCENLRYFEKIRKMIEWKNNSEVFKKFQNYEFANFLYSSYGFKTDISILKGKVDVKNVNVEFIEDKDVEDRGIIERIYNSSNKITDYAEISRKKTALGILGQNFALDFEKNNNKKYADDIKDVSKNTSLGYDILSYNKNGVEKHIEVKTSSTGSLDKIDFYITENEYNKLLNDPLYVIYYVVGIKSKEPKIIALKKNNFKNATFHPIVYRVRGMQG